MGEKDMRKLWIDTDTASDDAVAAFLSYLEDFSVREGVDFTISATADPAAADPRIKKYF